MLTAFFFHERVTLTSVSQSGGLSELYEGSIGYCLLVMHVDGRTVFKPIER